MPTKKFYVLAGLGAVALSGVALKTAKAQLVPPTKGAVTIVTTVLNPITVTVVPVPATTSDASVAVPAAVVPASSPAAPVYIPPAKSPYVPPTRGALS